MAQEHAVIVNEKILIPPEASTFERVPDKDPDR
jgi:hypothetical protein